ncbi:enoyl-CoA hydratase/isomerase family protein [Rhodococcus koreensis]
MNEVTMAVDDGIAQLTINRPRQRNALSQRSVAELREGIIGATSDRTVRAIVVTGAGDEFFCAGGDLSEVLESLDDPINGARERRARDRLVDDLRLCGKPTIARVTGPAIGAGFGLALACDFVVATPRARFQLPESLVGLWPYSITSLLIDAVGPRRALQLILTAESLDSVAARKLGIVYEVVTPDADIDDFIHQLVTTIGRGSPQAIAAGRTAFYRSTGVVGAAAEAILEHALDAALTLPDAIEGMTAFTEKRRPHWQ